VAGKAGLDTGSLNNEQGLISAAAGDGEIRSQQSVNNTRAYRSGKNPAHQRGRCEQPARVIVASGTTLALGSGTLDNRSGSLLSQGALNVDSGAINNQDGFLASDGNFALNSGMWITPAARLARTRA
jgi:filamentous hemagglutinin